MVDGGVYKYHHKLGTTDVCGTTIQGRYFMTYMLEARIVNSKDPPSKCT